MGTVQHWNNFLEGVKDDLIENPYLGVYKVSIDEKSRILIPSSLREIKQKRDDIIFGSSKSFKKDHFYLYSHKDSELLFLTDVNNQPQVCLKNLVFDNTNRLTLGNDIKKYFENCSLNNDVSKNKKNSLYLIGHEDYIYLGKLNDIKFVFQGLEKILDSL